MENNNHLINRENPINELEDRIRELRNRSDKGDIDLSNDIGLLEREMERLKKKGADNKNLSPYEIVKITRHPLRPSTNDYIELIIDDFIELHGDRRFGDDNAIVTGIGKLEDKKILIVGHRKGKTTKERISCHFGMPNPEGYRKALLKMKLAERFNLPIITFIDTPGANPDIGAEERGQAQAIAENIYSMFLLKTPIISIVIGEGGSGGALGIGVCDRFIMLEYACFSVISPEGCAAILWKDSKNAPQAANALKLTAPDLYKLGIVDEIVPEPPGSAQQDPQKMSYILKQSLIRNLDELKGYSIDNLIQDRYKRYRRIGDFFEKI